MNKILEFDKLVSIAPLELQEWFDRCEKTPQTKTWHPEGPNKKVPHNCLIHTKIVYERARQSGNIDYALAGLFHDLGKADSTHLNKKGTYSAYGHEFISARLVIKYQDWISSQGGDANLIHDIVINHMKVKLMSDMRKTKQEEFRKKPNFEHILKFSEFDNMQNLTKEELSL